MIKTCKLCGKQFETSSGRKTVCNDKHYTTCVICGSQIEIKYPEYIPKTCSMECRMKLRDQTCLEKYGTKDPGNSEAAKEKRRQTNLARYGVDNPSKSREIVSKIKNTWMDKYGVENVSQLESHKRQFTEAWKNKSDAELSEISRKRRQTCQIKYGVDNPMQSKEIQEKSQDTCLKRYGTKYAIISRHVRQKSNETMLRKYGTIYPNQLEIIQNKRRATCLERFGADHPYRSKEYVEKLRAHNLKTTGYEWYGQDPESISKRVQTNMERYGVPAAFLLPENMDKARDSMLSSKRGRISKINVEFKELLDTLNIESTLEFRLDNKFYDICIPSQNILIEIDPTWTHCSEGNMYQNLDKNYHRDKSRLAKQHGYHCIHIFDWDDWDKIISLLNVKDNIYARKCEVVYIDDESCDVFLQHNHLQGTVSGQIACLGLLYNNKLVQVMTFGRSRYSTKYQWELLRLCTSNTLRVIGGASKLFSKFVQDVNPESIISYCNLAKFNGDVYKNLGFKHVRDNQPSIWWSRGEKKVISDTLLRQRGYDQLFKTHYGKGTSNHDLMLQHHWRPVYDCGQGVYEWGCE